MNLALQQSSCCAKWGKKKMQVRKLDSVGLSRDFALRYIVRDMGNGVDRIELAEPLVLDQALIEASLPGRHKISIDAGSRMASLATIAVQAIGFEPEDHCILDGIARPLDEYSVEVICWCKH